MLLNGAPRTIVGVMSQGFNFPLNADLWIPYRNDFPLKTRINSRNFWFVFGRLKDGVTVDEALTEFNGIAARLEQVYPESNKGLNTLDIEPYTKAFMGDWMVNRLLTMLGAVFLVLLIACSNVANLLTCQIDPAKQRTGNSKCHRCAKKTYHHSNVNREPVNNDYGNNGWHIDCYIIFGYFMELF